MGAFRLKKAPRIPAVSPVLVAVIASIALIVIGFELFADLLFVTPPETLCPLRAGTGIPCPGCGGTRSARALLEFDLPSALAHNPLLAFGALVVFAAALSLVMWGFTAYHLSLVITGLTTKERIKGRKHGASKLRFSERLACCMPSAIEPRRLVPDPRSDASSVPIISERQL